MLPVLQRSAVILKDVLDHSLADIAATLATTVPAVKAALVRGRRSLRAQPAPDVAPWRDRPETSARERARLELHVALFNARDWSGLRDLLAEECRLDLVSRSDCTGKGQIGPYLANYAADSPRLALGRVEGRMVIGVHRATSTSTDRPDYILSLDWRGDRVSVIRDYRYVPYIMEEVEYDPEEAKGDVQ